MPFSSSSHVDLAVPNTAPPSTLPGHMYSRYHPSNSWIAGSPSVIEIVHMFSHLDNLFSLFGQFT